MKFLKIFSKIIIIILILAIGFIIIYNSTSLKYYNWKMVGISGYSHSKEESKEIGMYICDVISTNRLVSIDDKTSVIILDGWLEKRWIYPNFLGEIKKCNGNYDLFQVILKIKIRNYEYFDKFIEISVSEPHKGFGQNTFREKDINDFCADYKDTSNFEENIIYILKGDKDNINSKYDTLGSFKLKRIYSQ